METSSTAGYSGTPLFKKLGIKEAHRVLLLDAPKAYEGLLAPLPPAVVFVTHPDATVDIAHAFVTQREELAKRLSLLRKKLKPDAALWISWPKKSAKVPSTVTEDTIRELALPLGYVDVKVCAVTEVWSGLKLVLRKEPR
ncbi:DUF3052 domain-containing protein [Paucibacter sp. DJ2R-2]|uniref:DUF3052 domain-containing protein n=1 Tax=Paucibacter sp. DJ2R-2 TaxID=2893558 RepID=UPI0021E48B91|nr:DUF3052 domain-containing protein [Paucibacter sp. DJ2R-2]MCV2420907.1 DUF3052 domain-containing protein [Paucibacter sp. DJ4R-1]MCV2440106.1 DUF3052 domain-containing protein [Paucibacter sp. DJ2R-2]